MSKYKLSKSGIERLERFKANIENGDFTIAPQSHNGAFLYYAVHDADSITCCFTKTEEEAKTDALKQIQVSLSGEIEKGDIMFIVTDGLALNKSDVELIQNK